MYEFESGAMVYKSCTASDQDACANFAWRNAQWFRSNEERRQAAEAARRLCREGRGYACLALGAYYRDGLGIHQDLAKQAESLGLAFTAGVRNFPCQWVRSCETANLAQGCRTTAAEELERACALAEIDKLHRGVTKTDVFYVKRAHLLGGPGQASHADRSDGKSTEDPSSIISGTGLVFSIRTFDPGYLERIDDESFEKISIEIQAYQVGEPVQLTRRDVHFYFSSGSSAFDSSAGAMYASGAYGTITVTSVDPVNDAMRATIEMSWVPKSSHLDRPFQTITPVVALPGSTRSLHGQFIFDLVDVANLSPWLGGERPGLRSFP